MFKFITDIPAKIYDQSLSYLTRNSCTIYTMIGMIGDMYGIYFTNEEIIKIVEKAKKDGVLSFWGAVFDEIYPWFANEIFKRTGIEIEIKKVNINSGEFYEMCQEGYSFGLGLKHANDKYKESIEDGKLTEEEIKIIKAHDAQYQHNHRYYKHHIIENYKYKFGDNTINLHIKALREAVKIGVYYVPARTLVPIGTEFNKLVVKYLQEMKKFNVKKDDNFFTLHMTKLQGAEKRAFMRASKLKYLKR